MSSGIYTFVIADTFKLSYSMYSAISMWLLWTPLQNLKRTSVELKSQSTPSCCLQITVHYIILLWSHHMQYQISRRPFLNPNSRKWLKTTKKKCSSICFGRFCSVPCFKIIIPQLAGSILVESAFSGVYGFSRMSCTLGSSLVSWCF